MPAIEWGLELAVDNTNKRSNRLTCYMKHGCCRGQRIIEGKALILCHHMLKDVGMSPSTQRKLHVWKFADEVMHTEYAKGICIRNMDKGYMRLSIPRIDLCRGL